MCLFVHVFNARKRKKLGVPFRGIETGANFVSKQFITLRRRSGKPTAGNSNSQDANNIARNQHQQRRQQQQANGNSRDRNSRELSTARKST